MTELIRATDFSVDHKQLVDDTNRIIEMYPFNIIAISSIIYLLMLPISFFHYQKLKKQHADSNSVDDDDLEDML